MCLHTVDKETKQVSEGWKIFKIVNNELKSLRYPCKNIYNNKIHTDYIKTNEWIKDSKNEILVSYCDEKYQTGFHFYFNEENAKKDAEIWKKELERFLSIKLKVKVFKIKVRNIVATGLQGMYKAGVAREIFIEEE